MNAPLLYLAFDAEEQRMYRDKLLDLGVPEQSIQFFAKADTEIMLGSPRIISQHLVDAPNLKWAHATWAGIEPLLTTRNNYLLSNTRGVFGQLMAEFVFGYILLLEKNILPKLENQKKHQWDKQLPATLRGKKIGILGVGSIGSEIARFSKMFGITTYGMARSQDQNPYIDKFFGKADAKEFCKDLDYFICVLPNTNETRHFVDRSFLEKLPVKTILFNVGRGATVDEETLSELLINNRLRAAVLDVFKQEPLSSDSPLWDVPNLYITSHTSAPSFVDDVIGPFWENYGRYLQKSPLLYLVDFNKQY